MDFGNLSFFGKKIYKESQIPAPRGGEPPLGEMQNVDYSNRVLGKRNFPGAWQCPLARSPSLAPKGAFAPPREPDSFFRSPKTFEEGFNLKHFAEVAGSGREVQTFLPPPRDSISSAELRRNPNFPRIGGLELGLRRGGSAPAKAGEGFAVLVWKERKEGTLPLEKEGSPRTPKRAKLMTPWVQTHLAELSTFLTSLFTYERLSPDFSRLSRQERAVFVSVVRTKNYLRKDKLIGVLGGSSAPDPDLWIRFKKERRKEEHLKYGFKMIFKQMQADFVRQLAARDPGLGASFAPADLKLFFYLHHFGEASFHRDRAALFAELRSGRLSKKRAWKKLSKFVLPEMGVPSDFCGVKTINREFIKHVSRLQDFALLFLDRIVDVQLFLGYCWAPEWGRAFAAGRVCARDRVGIEVLRMVGAVNRKEIKKLFSEWSNLIDRSCAVEKKRPSEGGAGPEQNFELIRRSVQRPNFKFPWTFVEVWEASVETFLSFVEFINFDRLPKTAKSGLTRARVSALRRGLLHAPLQHAAQPLRRLPQTVRPPFRHRPFPQNPDQRAPFQRRRPFAGRVFAYALALCGRTRGGPRRPAARRFARNSNLEFAFPKGSEKLGQGSLRALAFGGPATQNPFWR